MDNKQSLTNDRPGMEPFLLLNLIIRFKNAFLQMWALVVVMAILFGALSWYRAKSTFVPMYQVKAIFTVDTGYTPEDIFGTGTYYDQYAAQQLAAAFPMIMSTEMMQDLVIRELDRGYINGYAQAFSVAGSNMLVLTVTGNNPKDIYDYMDAIIKCFPQVAVFMVDYPQVKIITKSNIPQYPYNQLDEIGSAVKGAALGTILSLLFILLCAALTKTIQTAEELKAAINIPILVALPKVEVKKRRSKAGNLITADSDPNLTESMRGLRMKVKKMLRDADKKVVLITSTLAGEGKTTIAVNVAASLSRDGHRVLLLDADLHSQSVSRVLEEEIDHDGLMECLKEDPVSVFSCIRSNEGQKVDFISGRSTDRRHYTLNVNKVNALLNQLKERYDYIVIDTPPNDVVSDAMALCRCADCVLYVIRQDYVQRNQVINSMVSMHAKGITIHGCIFNGVPRYQRQYGYGYRYGYGYGYDYGHNKYHYGDKYRYGYYSAYSAYAPKKKRKHSKTT